jgi:hypothetical protein
MFFFHLLTLAQVTYILDLMQSSRAHLKWIIFLGFPTCQASSVPGPS